MADLLGSVFFRTQFAVTVVQDRHSLAGGLLPTVQQVKMQLRCSEVRAANSLDDYSEIDFIAGKNNGIIIQGESLPAAVCCLLCYCDHTETNTLSYHPRHIKAQPYPLQWRCGPLPPPPLPFPTRYGGAKNFFSLRMGETRERGATHRAEQKGRRAERFGTTRVKLLGTTAQHMAAACTP
ncbi:uncharacterized protein LOC135107037 isoform X5 [Scylla paramamosain]|uniref:uncharacterized protein LOC135107037 isoform X5 n=1 Tax=Scylla paramamosain TaxID=85552 RepID=UPI003083C728